MSSSRVIYEALGPEYPFDEVSEPDDRAKTRAAYVAIREVLGVGVGKLAAIERAKSKITAEMRAQLPSQLAEALAANGEY